MSAVSVCSGARPRLQFRCACGSVGFHGGRCFDIGAWSGGRAWLWKRGGSWDQIPRVLRRWASIPASLLLRRRLDMSGWSRRVRLWKRRGLERAQIALLAIACFRPPRAGPFHCLTFSFSALFLGVGAAVASSASESCRPGRSRASLAGAKETVPSVHQCGSLPSVLGRPGLASPFPAALRHRGASGRQTRHDSVSFICIRPRRAHGGVSR